MQAMKSAILALALLQLAGCASNKSSTAPTAAQPAAQPAQAKAPDSRIDGNFPANSPFAKIQLGMAQGQVHEILGQPTDSKQYQTGKMWIPFYFGPDMMRMDEFYKGVGVITYTGMGMGGVHWKVHRAVYNSAEDGYPDN